MKQYYYFKKIMAGTKVVGAKEDGSRLVWRVPFYSKEDKVRAGSEEEARDSMYAKLKAKWTGFLYIGPR